MTNYTWQVLSLYTKPSLDGLTDVVRRVTWRYQITDGGNYGEIYKDTYLPDPTATNPYIAYANLTEETILGWIRSIEDIPTLQAELQLRLEKSKNPDILENKLPWILEDRYKPREDKYVMANNGKVMYGPVHWHSDSMNASLESLGVARSMPDDILAFRKGIVPYDQPLVVNDNVKIYKAMMINDQPPENPWCDNGHIEWDFSTGIAVGTYESVPKPASDGKQYLSIVFFNMREQMDGLPIKMTINNEIIYVGLHPMLKANLYMKMITLDDTTLVDWKFEHNKWLKINKSNILEILTAVEARTSEISAWELKFTKEKDQASTVEELQDILRRAEQEFLQYGNDNPPPDPVSYP